MAFKYWDWFVSVYTCGRTFNSILYFKNCFHSGAFSSIIEQSPSLVKVPQMLVRSCITLNKIAQSLVETLAEETDYTKRHISLETFTHFTVRHRTPLGDTQIYFCQHNSCLCPATQLLVSYVLSRWLRFLNFHISVYLLHSYWVLPHPLKQWLELLQSSCNEAGGWEFIQLNSLYTCSWVYISSVSDLDGLMWDLFFYLPKDES